MMKTRQHVRPQRLFVFISLLLLLTLLLAACGGSTTSGGSVSPTPGKTATLQTSCPLAGTARAAIMAPLALGKQDTFVYLEGSQPTQQGSGSYTLKRYTVSTRTTTDLLSVPDTPYFGAQISADGQWVILNPFLSGQRAIQLIRMDGQGLQTLYCGKDFGLMQWSPDNKYVAFVDVGTSGSDPGKETFKLLNTTTGTMQTKARDSSHMLAFPQAWLDPTHLLVVMSGLPGEGGEKLSLLDITTGISKPILNSSSLPSCMDATHSLDGSQLFTSFATDCHQVGSAGTNRGPSSIQVQAATGGPAKTIYSTQTYAITALRVATSTSLLLLITTDWEPSHNGLWKVNADGSGLTKLNSAATIIKDPAHEAIGFAGQFGWTMNQPWANTSRDGAYYSIVVTFNDYTGTVNGPNRILVGSMNGGAPVTIASSHDATPIGWTTM